MGLLRTTAQACGYWPERSARNVVLDANANAPAAVYPELLAAGFRRSGEVVYRPRCDACSACVPVRIPVAGFRPDRAQRRCLTRNTDLAVTLESARHDHEVLDLYGRYVDARHPGSGMTTRDPEEFSAMFLADWARTKFVCARAEGQLLAVAITDVTALGCSAVYTFFEFAGPYASRSLGTFAILAQVALTRALELPHLYLGYWLDRHPNMHYKLRFRPQQQLRSEGWIDLG
ncbi:MAG: arginyltransferase [Lysobacterales bacterium]